MKDYSNYLTEKFSCNVDGCLMKFTNEDNLIAHKKRHDMFLNIGLAPKCGTFTDQTPTPTQFIRNCEEVGLFQDLQNVNPFEEKFKEAVDAVKAGQPIFMGKSFQSNPPDDTLHTPNIFPHITDLPNVDQQDFSKPENIPSNDDTLLQENLPDKKTGKGDTVVSDQVIQQTILNQSNDNNISINVNTVETSPLTQSTGVILNVAEGHFIKVFTPNAQSSCDMVVINKAPENLYASSVPLLLREKIKKNMRNKKIKGTPQGKIPIAKCTSKKVPLSNKFSKFSKNAMKLLLKMENPNAENSNKNEDVMIKNKKNKLADKNITKESRSEYLARSRAASSRCRQKKKMYVLYLEKVNGELLEANKNLKILFISLQNQLRDLHSELLKHQNCNATDEQTKILLWRTINLLNSKLYTEQNIISKDFVKEKGGKKNWDISPVNNNSKGLLETSEAHTEIISGEITDYSTIDVAAEVTLDGDSEENEIPLNDSMKSSGIIARFNCFGSDIPPRLPSEPYLDGYINGVEKNGQQLCMEHSYFQKNYTVDIDKHFINYKKLKETIISVPPVNSVTCNFESTNMKLEKNETFPDLTDLNEKLLLEPKNPPPLILLKPFKKRSLQSKQTEKT